MLRTVTVDAVHTQVVLNNIFLKINLRNKDPCCGLRLLCLRI